MSNVVTSETVSKLNQKKIGLNVISNEKFP